jgi:hypothetical protein
LREFRDLSYADARMKNLLLTLVHLAVAVARLCGPGGIRAVIAENLLLKHQLIVLRRGRQRAPNLTQSDRLLCGFGSLFLDATRIRKVAIAFRLSTLLAFHQALVRRKYRLLFSARRRPKKPGPKGPDEALIRAIIELKSRNPRFGCPRIARIVAQTFGIDIDKNVVHRVLAKHYRPLPGGTGPSWLSFIGHATDSLWSVDLFRCESIVLRTYWVLVVMDQFTRRLVGFGVHCGTVTGAPMSVACSTARFKDTAHRDVSVPIMIRCSRRTGGQRTCGFWRSMKSKLSRTCRCRTHSWNAWSERCGENSSITCCSGMRVIWNRSLPSSRRTTTRARCHASLDGQAPLTLAGGQTVAPADLNQVRWVSHCRDLVQLPIAA